MGNVQTLTVTVLNRSLASLGTITTALTASGDHYAERVGSGSLTFPAADEDAKALIEDANAYAVQIQATLRSSGLIVDIAAFIIDDEEEIVTGDERLAEMAISGPDLLQELAEQSLGYNVIDSSGNPDTSDVTNIMTYHSGWGVSFVPSGTGTDNGSYLAASGETVLEALLLTREKSGDHFRRSAVLSSRTIEWVKTADSTGITLQMPSPTTGFTPSATVGFIMGIRRSERKLQKYTRVHCTGAGLGDGRLTLEPLNSPTFHTQPTPPAGYSVDWTGSIITNTSLETALGYEIERYEQFGTIRAQDSSDEFTGPLQLETAALDLYRAGLTFLQEHDSDEEFLEITAVLHNEVKPAQTIVLSYTNPYTDMALSGTYFIHEVRYRYGRDGILTADLLLSQNITRTPPGTELESHAGVIKKIDEIIRHTGAGTSTGTPITPPSSYQLSLSGAVDDIFQISAPGGPSQTLSFDVTAKGSIIAGDATNFIKLAVGANDTVLTADSAQTTGLKWAAIAGLLPVTIVDAGGNGDYTTLGAAMAAASNGERIWVFGAVSETANFNHVNNVSVYITPGAKIDLAGWLITIPTGVTANYFGYGQLEDGEILMSGTSNLNITGLTINDSLVIRPEGSGDLHILNCVQQPGFSNSAIWDQSATSTGEIVINNSTLPGVYVDLSGAGVNLYITNSEINSIIFGDTFTLIATGSTIYEGIGLDTGTTVIYQCALVNTAGACLDFSTDQTKLHVTNSTLITNSGSSTHHAFKTSSSAFTGNYLFSGSTFYAATGNSLNSTNSWTSAPFYECLFRGAITNITFAAGTAQGSNTQV